VGSDSVRVVVDQEASQHSVEMNITRGLEGTRRLKLALSERCAMQASPSRLGAVCGKAAETRSKLCHCLDCVRLSHCNGQSDSRRRQAE